jgi:uncharacterized membrane protein
MATVTVLEFPTVNGAEDAFRRLRDLEKQDLITLHDAVAVSWPEGKKHPKAKQLLEQKDRMELDFLELSKFFVSFEAAFSPG